MPEYLSHGSPTSGPIEPARRASPKPTYGGRARISCDSPISNKAVLSVGGVAIPIYEATVRIVAGELVTIEATVLAEHIDLVAMEQNTRLIIERSEDRQPEGE